MENWRKVWRAGISPLLSTPGLESLRLALKNDDPRLVQGVATTPSLLPCVQDWPVEGACAVTFCGWQGDGLDTVAKAEEFFNRVFCEVDHYFGEPAACRWFLNWFDVTPRDDMRRQLLVEVNRVLIKRKGKGKTP